VEPITITNTGLFTFGTPPPNAVFVVTGVSHGGTTYVFDLVKRFGVHCFFDNEINQEDYHLSEAIEAGRTEQAAEIIARRPPRWAFKRPYIYRHKLREIFGDRLCWLFVFRCPFAVAGRMVLSNGGDVQEWLTHCGDDIAELAEFAAEAAEPKTFLSYEKYRDFEHFLNPRLQGWLK